MLESHQRALHKVCWVYGKSSHDRDDLFQEIISQLWRSFGKYDRQRSFSTWMYRIALNVAIDFQRRQRRRSGEIQHLGSGQTDVPDATHDDAAKIEQQHELRELLETLDDADRALLVLYLEGHSLREIGDVLGINESNVSTRLYRLKKSLRQSVEEFPDLTQGITHAT